MQLISFPEITVQSGVSFLVCPALAAQTGLFHCFSTRRGGISLPPRDSLNLSLAAFGAAQTESGEADCVAENYRRLLAAAFSPPAALVFTRQVHENTVRRVDKRDCLPVEQALSSPACDGLVSDAEEVVLSTYMADCVPMLLFDPVRRACCALHAGWRGTAMAIAERGVAAMADQFGSHPADLLAAVGPSIGACCFLCHDDVPAALAALGDHAVPDIRPVEDGRFSINLKQINARLLERAGVRQVFVSDACTCCDETRFFSHRRQGLPRGTLAAMIGLFP